MSSNEKSSPAFILVLGSFSDISAVLVQGAVAQEQAAGAAALEPAWVEMYRVVSTSWIFL